MFTVANGKMKHFGAFEDALVFANLLDAELLSTFRPNNF